MPSSHFTWESFQKNQPIVCRPALPKDTPDVMELTRTIWEGEDYVPKVWREWLEDFEGLLAVAERAGKVVGTGKLTRFSPGDWWLEGLRVHPDLQGLGIGSHLHDYLLEYWLRICQGTLRLATASFRLAVHHMAERSGFHKVAEFTSYIAKAIEGETPQFTVLAPHELSEAVRFAYQSQTFSLSSYLMDLGWQWTAANETYLAEAARKEKAWWWRDRRGLLVAWEDRESTVPQEIISIAACQIDDLATLLIEYRALVGKAGFSEAVWSAPVQSQLTPLLTQAGFTREWEDSVYVYARHHSIKPSHE
jgi:GNAT superfamily N-acetyltransferase